MSRHPRAPLAWAGVVGLLALLLTWASVLHPTAGPRDWVGLALFALGATIAHAFPVRSAAGGATYQTTGVFVLAAAVALPPELLAPLVLVALAPWAWRARRRPGGALRWAFNAAQTIVAAGVAGAWVALTGGRPLDDGWALLALLGAAVLFALVQAALVGTMIALQARVPLARSGPLAVTALLGDVLLGILGVLLAAMWQANPTLVGLVLPLLLIAHRLTRTAHLAHLAEVDVKTGLPSFATFEWALADELARGRRTGRPLALLFADMDRFKAINDRHGHAAGARVLREAAAVLRETVGRGGMVARFGGEEFVVVLPGTEITEAMYVAEQLRAAIAGMPFTLDDGTTIRCTISIGVAAWPRHGADAAALLRQADLAMYTAKRTRDAVAQAPDPPPAPALPGAPAAAGDSAAPVAGGPTDAAAAAGPVAGGRAESGRSPLGAPPTAESSAPEPAPPASASVAGPGEDLEERRLRWFVATVGGAGLGVLILAIPALSADLLLRLLPFFLLVVLAERLSDLQFGDRTSISIGSIVTMAAAATGGPAAGAAVGVVNGLATLRRGHLSPIKSPFNVATIALSGAAAGLPFWFARMGDVPGESAVSWPTLLVGIGGGLAFFAVNYGLLAMVLALASGTTWLAEWRLRCGWLAPHYGVMGSIGAGLMMLYQAHGVLGLVLLLAPAAMLSYAQRQYVAHTAAYVNDLSTLNGELTASNRRLGDTLGELRDANEAMLGAFSEALELRDRETEGHCQRVVAYARAMAVELGLGQAGLTAVMQGALLHDIGKMGVPDAILHKPGPLTPEERAQIERHAEIGYRMIAHIPFLGPASLLVRHHHERWDGRGYPDGLAGEAIPLGARIFAVADTFDAMTSDRPYRAALSWEVALAELEKNSGTQFDPRVVAAFADLVARGALHEQGGTDDQAAA